MEKVIIKPITVIKEDIKDENFNPIFIDVFSGFMWL